MAFLSMLHVLKIQICRKIDHTLTKIYNHFVVGVILNINIKIKLKENNSFCSRNNCGIIEMSEELKFRS